MGKHLSETEFQQIGDLGANPLNNKISSISLTIKGNLRILKVKFKNYLYFNLFSYTFIQNIMMKAKRWLVNVCDSASCIVLLILLKQIEGLTYCV